MNVSGECIIHIFTSAMKLQTVCSSESFLPMYQTVWHHNPRDVDYLCLDTVAYRCALFFLMELREHLHLVM
jgi:hypothetical protein